LLDCAAEFIAPVDDAAWVSEEVVLAIEEELAGGSEVSTADGLSLLSLEGVGDPLIDEEECAS